jgi:hypothetical protein
VQCNKHGGNVYVSQRATVGDTRGMQKRGRDLRPDPSSFADRFELRKPSDDWTVQSWLERSYSSARRIETLRCTTRLPAQTHDDSEAFWEVATSLEAFEQCAHCMRTSLEIYTRSSGIAILAARLASLCRGSCRSDEALKTT